MQIYKTPLREFKFLIEDFLNLKESQTLKKLDLEKSDLILIIEEAEKLGRKYYLYKLTGGYTTSPEGSLRLHNKDDEKGFEVSGRDTIAIIRGSVTRKDSWMDIVSLLEKHSVCVVNSRETISVCADKYRTALRLADYGVKQPVTHLINDPENSEQAFENLNTQYPIILKH